MPKGGRIAVGDRITTKDGVVMEVVDKPQKRQTRGYWCHGANYNVVAESAGIKLFRDKTPGLYSAFSWGIYDKNHSLAVDGTYITQEQFLKGFSKPGALCLCPVSELDEKKNEFGTVCP